MHLIRRTLEGGFGVGVLIEGWVEVDLIDARTGLITQHLRFRNLITDAGLDNLHASGQSSISYYCNVGTSNIAPTVADTALGAEVGTGRVSQNSLQSGINGYAGDTPDYYWKKDYYFFDETKANGVLSEFGLFDNNVNGTMWCRALLKDGNGNPTTIPKTNSDQLKITYEYRLYPPVNDVTTTIDISGTNYDLTRRAINVSAIGGGWSQGLNNWPSNANGALAIDSSVLPARNTYDSGAQSDTHTSFSDAAYVAGTFYRDRTYRFDPNKANFAGGIGRLSIGSGWTPYYDLFQLSFNPKVPKDNTKRFTLTVRESWGRAP